MHFLPFSPDTFNNPPADVTALELWILAAGLAMGSVSFGGFRKFQPELLGCIILIGIGMKVCIQHLLANL